MSDAGWGIIFLLGIIAAVSLFLSITVWQVFRTEQAKSAAAAAIAHDGAYRSLAEDATTTSRKIAEDQERIAGELADLRTRVVAIEKMLREVG